MYVSVGGRGEFERESAHNDPPEAQLQKAAADWAKKHLLSV